MENEKLNMNDGGLEPLRLAGYLRVSATGSDAAMYLVEQQNAVQRFADEGGHEVSRYYLDSGSDGRTPGTALRLDQLLEDAKSDECDFNAVVVWSFSRLSRDITRFAAVRQTLADYGIVLVSITETSNAGGFERALQDLVTGPAQVHVDGRRS